MSAKIKLALVALMLIAGNEVLTWVILAVLFFSALAAFAKEAMNDV
jgi:hypothetical protein